jgi:hypothetical protein
MKLTQDTIRQLIQEELSGILAEETIDQQRQDAITQISNLLVRLEGEGINAQDILNQARESYDKNRQLAQERKLTEPEKEKREEVAQAMEEEDPNIDMSKKMAIATAQAKKNA